MMREVDFGLIHAELEGGSSKQKAKLAISKSQVVNASSADDGILHIKIANEITSATYAIQSKDLIINFADDHEILILKYLSQARVPSLVSDTGRFISRETIFTLTRFEQNTKPTPAVAGQVLSITGKAYVKRISGVKGELAEGDDIFQGDYLATPRGGEIHIRLADGSEYKIGQEARVTIDKLAYSSKPDLHLSVLGVLQGELTFKSGDIARHPAGEAIINTPVAVLSLKGDISGGWTVDEEGAHKFFAECPGDSCNGKVEIKTLAGDRGLYQPNIFISVENMLKVPVQLTNLDNPKAMSMGEVVAEQGGDESSAEIAEEVVAQGVSVAGVVEKEPVAVKAEEQEVAELPAESELPVPQLEVKEDETVVAVEEAPKAEASARAIPVIDFYSEEKTFADEVAEQPAPVEASDEVEVAPEAQEVSEEAAHELPQAVMAEPEVQEEVAAEEVEEPIIAQEVAAETVEEETEEASGSDAEVVSFEEPVQEAQVEEVQVASEEAEVEQVAVEEETIVGSEVVEETAAEEAVEASAESAAEATLEQIEEKPEQNVIKLVDTADKVVNGHHLNGKNGELNGHHNGHKVNGAVNGAAKTDYFYPEKFVEFKGIEYDKLKFEKSSDGEDLVIKVINGTPTSGHMIVLKGFFGHDSAQTSFEISQSGITQHKVN